MSDRRVHRTKTQLFMLHIIVYYTTHITKLKSLAPCLPPAVNSATPSFFSFRSHPLSDYSVLPSRRYRPPPHPTAPHSTVARSTQATLKHEACTCPVLSDHHPTITVPSSKRDPPLRLNHLFRQQLILSVSNSSTRRKRVILPLPATGKSTIGVIALPDRTVRIFFLGEASTSSLFLSSTTFIRVLDRDFLRAVALLDVGRPVG